MSIISPYKAHVNRELKGLFDLAKICGGYWHGRKRPFPPAGGLGVNMVSITHAQGQKDTNPKGIHCKIIT